MRIKRSGKVFLLIAVIILFLSILLFFLFNTFFSVKGPVIKVSGAFSLYPLMTVWAKEYEAQHGVKVEVSGGGAGKGMTDALSGLVDIGMVSREIREEEIKKGAFYVAVARDSVVAIVNSNNPVLEKLLVRGISKETFVRIYITGEITRWGQVVNTSNTDYVRVYTRADACGAAETWAKYLGNYTQDDLDKYASASINGDPDLVGAIARDRYGLGYCNVNFAYDLKKGQPVSGITVVPLDLNNNSYVEENESFYSNRTKFVNAVSEGKYPSPPTRSLYLVAKNNFTGYAKEFVRWILGTGPKEGQSFVEENGYVLLSPAEVRHEREALETGIRTNQ